MPTMTTIVATISGRDQHSHLFKLVQTSNNCILTIVEKKTTMDFIVGNNVPREMFSAAICLVRKRRRIEDVGVERIDCVRRLAAANSPSRPRGVGNGGRGWEGVASLLAECLRAKLDSLVLSVGGGTRQLTLRG